MKSLKHKYGCLGIKMSTMTEVMVLRDHCRPVKIEQKRNVKITNYDYFFTPVTKSRVHNYLRAMGDKMTMVRGKAIRFSNGTPNPQCFPYEEIKVKLKNGDSFQVDGNELNECLGYGHCNGFIPLIDLLKNFQGRLHGEIDWNEKSLATTAGSQAGLHSVIEMCVSPGDPVLIQSPLYTGVIAILQPLNVEYLEVENDDNGICHKNLEKILQERKEKRLPMPKIFLTNPVGTNPTGEIMSTETKKEIYKIACHYNLLIFEDDPYLLLRYDLTKKPTSFLSLDTENRVVRFDSVSKTMGAGFRIGYVTAANEIVEKLNIVKSASSMSPPFTQMIVYKTLTSLGYEGFIKHTNYSSNFYSNGCQIILKSLDKYLKDEATWIIPKAAMFVWIDIKNIDDVPDSFIHKCIEKLVFITPGFAFYAKPRKSPSIRLAFSMVAEDQLEKGIEILAELIKKDLLKKK